MEVTDTAGSVTLTRWLTIGGSVIGTKTTSGVTDTTYWNCASLQNSVTCQTLAGATSIPARKRYKPYGDDRNAVTFGNTDHGFLNQPEDTSGLTYLNNRYYDPGLGAFTSVDPLVGKTGTPYLYAGGNPTTLSDPSGLDPHDMTKAMDRCTYRNEGNDCVGVDFGLKGPDGKPANIALSKLVGGMNRTLGDDGVRSDAVIGDFSGDTKAMLQRAWIRWILRNEPAAQDPAVLTQVVLHMDDIPVAMLTWYDLIISNPDFDIDGFAAALPKPSVVASSGKPYDPQCGCGQMPDGYDQLSAFFAFPTEFSNESMKNFFSSTGVTLPLSPLTVPGFVIGFVFFGGFGLALSMVPPVDPDDPADPNNLCVNLAGFAEWPPPAGC